MPINQFWVVVNKLGVQNEVNRIATNRGGLDGIEKSEGNAHTLATFAVALKDKTKAQSFIFLWTPPPKLISVFSSVKVDSKSKQPPTTFALSLRLRLVDANSGSNFWKLKVDLKEAKVKDVRKDPRMDEQLVEIDYVSAEWGPE